MRAGALVVAILAALLLAACGGSDGDSRDAASTLQRLDAYEGGNPALVFVYTDG